MRLTQEQIELFIAALEAEGRAKIAYVFVLELEIESLEAGNTLYSPNLIETKRDLAVAIDKEASKSFEAAVSMRMFSSTAGDTLKRSEILQHAKEREKSAGKSAQEITAMVMGWSRKVSTPSEVEDVAGEIAYEVDTRNETAKLLNKAAEAWKCLRESLT